MDNQYNPNPVPNTPPNPKEEMKKSFHDFTASVRNYFHTRISKCQPETKRTLMRVKIDSDFVRAGLIGYVVGVIGTRRVLVKPLICATIFASLWQMAKIKI